MDGRLIGDLSKGYIRDGVHELPDPAPLPGVKRLRSTLYPYRELLNG